LVLLTYVYHDARCTIHNMYSSHPRLSAGSNIKTLTFATRIIRPLVCPYVRHAPYFGMYGDSWKLHIQLYKQCTYNGKLRRVRCCGRANNITYSECMFLDLCIQHAMRVCCITFSCVTCLAGPYFSTLSHKRHVGGGGEGGMERKTRVLIFSITFVPNISHPKKKWARYNSKIRWLCHDNDSCVLNACYRSGICIDTVQLIHCARPSF
jgi:hypothetical protein